MIVFVHKLKLLLNVDTYNLHLNTVTLRHTGRNFGL